MKIPAPGTWPALPIVGSTESVGVRRILCIGKNYADHVKEMGGDVREPPVHFTKSPDALLAAPGPVTMPYPPATSNLHHELELVVSLGQGGQDVSVQDAPLLVFGYAVGLDMTRRDLQQRAKDKGGPWAAGKDFDASAIVGPIHPVTRVGHPRSGPIRLSVNGALRQDGDLSQMTWNVAELLAALSRLGALRAGDLIFTGTPAGVGPVVAGDHLVGTIGDLAPLDVTIG